MMHFRNAASPRVLPGINCLPPLKQNFRRPILRPTLAARARELGLVNSLTADERRYRQSLRGRLDPRAWRGFPDVRLWTLADVFARFFLANHLALAIC
jgi:hypothetical protein